MTVALVGAAAYCRCFIGRPATFLSSSTSTNPRYHSYGLVTRSGVRFLSPWKGLKHLSISFRRNYTYLEKKGKPGKMAVYASLFGVGAPEALVIGVVALLIFGPKGLAEVARNLGKTLRSFQPTIKELQEVSREFKSTFEREIGLDEMTSTINNSAYRSNLVVKESQQDVSDPNGRPTAESQELAEEPAAAMKSQADSPEEQYLAAKTLESTASHSGPEDTASVSPETTAQTRTEGDQDAKYG